jgi:hypothetical protein
MNIKTSDLTGNALNWAVAKCEGRGFVFGETDYTDGHTYQRGTAQATGPHYSTNWAQGGPIIERNLITIFRHDEEWFAHSQLSTPEDFHGDTPLIAAMRCYVASILGDTVNIPEELT